MKARRGIAPLPRLDVGAGPPLFLLHGYAMQPCTYGRLADLLADRARVVIPALFDLPGPWTFGRVMGCLEATLDELGLDRVSVMAHSFGGGLGLALAAQHPGRVAECIFSDTLGLRSRFRLATEALHNPFGLVSMATPLAIKSFVRSWSTHPGQLVAGALWGFASDREGDIDRVVHEGIPSHVLWANHDSLLARSDGEAFADRLRATFTVASGAHPSERVDHDWMFDDPELFVRDLERIGPQFLSR